MCGFAGVVDPNRKLSDPLGTARRMVNVIAHRGPDDCGSWVAPHGRMAMAFRRLAIQDLSEHGHQPMQSSSHRWSICFNGEVYNFLELRKELEALGHVFRGRSDTEVILAAIEEWGVRPAIERLVGMFAIALWDSREDELTLVRDRFGVKPLYFGCPGQEATISRGDGVGNSGQAIFFGSELKALRAAWKEAPAINTYALRLLLRYQYLVAPWTLWNGIRKLMPGHCLRYQLRTGCVSLEAYWSAGRILVEGARSPLCVSEEEVVEGLNEQIEQSIRERIIADVPYGAFLSGGVDSAVVVAAMRKYTSTRIKTFTIGSEDKSLDESNEAERVAAHLGTEHHTLRVSLAEARDPILRLGELADEPLGDASFIPTYLVSQFARNLVTVILSGDGGDEVFAGYPQHKFASRVWPWQKVVPRSVATVLRSLLLNASGSELRGSANLGRHVRTAQLNKRAAKALRVLGTRDRVSFMGQWRNVVHHPEDFLRDELEEEPPLLTPDFPLESLGHIRSECWADITSYLPDDILPKVDRASMAVSLEAREPLLDHRLFEFAARIPEHLLFREGQGKWILRQVLYRSVPKELVDSPKRGFAIPVAGWVVGPLRDWAESLISEDRLRAEGFFKPDAVRSAWKNLCKPGSTDIEMPFFGMWSILAFQAWLDHWN
jgi:asparagine synthase (glutamine-hydrolysing)